MTNIVHTFVRKISEEAPLVVLVHGRAGNLNVMQPFQRVIPDVASIVTIQAPIEEPTGGFSWWIFDPLLDLEQNRTEGAIASASLIEQFVKEFIASEKIKPSKIVGLGFSQGAAVLSAVIQHSPRLFDAIGLLCGFVVQLVPTESHPSKSRVFMFHGDQDPIVGINYAINGREYLVKRGHDVEWHQEAIGHKMGVAGMKALQAWLAVAILP